MYNGILVRSDFHSNFVTDPCVSRELALSPSGLAVAIDRGTGVETFWLNYEALSKIGKILDTNGTRQVGVKTSDLPITYDAGDLIIGASTFTVGGSVLAKSLKYINSVSATEIVFTDLATPMPNLVTANIAGLASVSTKSVELVSLANSILVAPTLTSPTTTSVTVTVRSGVTSFVVVNESEVTIGTGSATGTVTLSPTQTTGARIYCYALDVHKNKSLRSSILIP